MSFKRVVTIHSNFKLDEFESDAAETKALEAGSEKARTGGSKF